MKPSLFYGTAVAALMGLTLGLAFHSPWESRSGGPQTLVASAAADELARPANDSDIIEASVPSEQVAGFDNPYLDITQLPADPLPVVRLTHSGGQPIAAAQGIDRVSADAVEEVTTSNSPDYRVADAAPEPGQRPVVPISYTAGPAGF